MGNANPIKILKKKHKCLHCKYSTNSKHSLKIHIRTHTKEKPYKCNQCGDRFITNSQLCAHQKRYHALIKKYKCSFCCKAFVKKRELTHHTRTHTGEKLFKCSFGNCNKILASKRALSDHLKRHIGD